MSLALSTVLETNKATPSFNMLISSKQVACACADDVLSFAAAATTSSTQVYTTEKTISRHLKIIKIIRIILYSGVHNRKDDLTASQDNQDNQDNPLLRCTQQKDDLMASHSNHIFCFLVLFIPARETF